MPFHPEWFGRGFLRTQEPYNNAHLNELLHRSKPHGLRHFWATLALEEGIDILIISHCLEDSSTRVVAPSVRRRRSGRWLHLSLWRHDSATSWVMPRTALAMPPVRCGYHNDVALDLHGDDIAAPIAINKSATNLVDRRMQADGTSRFSITCLRGVPR